MILISLMSGFLFCVRLTSTLHSCSGCFSLRQSQSWFWHVHSRGGTLLTTHDTTVWYWLTQFRVSLGSHWKAAADDVNQSLLNLHVRASESCDLQDVACVWLSWSLLNTYILLLLMVYRHQWPACFMGQVELNQLRRSLKHWSRAHGVHWTHMPHMFWLRPDCLKSRTRVIRRIDCDNVHVYGRKKCEQSCKSEPMQLEDVGLMPLPVQSAIQARKLNNFTTHLHSCACSLWPSLD